MVDLDAKEKSNRSHVFHNETTLEVVNDVVQQFRRRHCEDHVVHVEKIGYSSLMSEHEH